MKPLSAPRPTPGLLYDAIASALREDGSVDLTGLDTLAWSDDKFRNRVSSAMRSRGIDVSIHKTPDGRFIASVQNQQEANP